MDEAPGIAWPSSSELDSYPGLKEVIAGLVERDPSKRWGIRELLLSSYFSQEVLLRVAVENPACAEDMDDLVVLQAQYQRERVVEGEAFQKIQLGFDHLSLELRSSAPSERPSVELERVSGLGLGWGMDHPVALITEIEVSLPSAMEVVTCPSTLIESSLSSASFGYKAEDVVLFEAKMAKKGIIRRIWSKVKTLLRGCVAAPTAY